MGRLFGKKAVITGGTRGIGLAVAEAYAREGAAVIISSRQQESVNSAAEELGQKGFQVKGFPADVSNMDQVLDLFRFTVDQLGGLDVWFNNAGIAGPYGPTWALDSDTFEQVIRTNILGVYYGSLVAMRYFLQQGHGKLINMLGAGSRRHAIYQTAYSSSKAWVRSFTRSVAEECKGTGVGVFAFSPGMVLTDLLTKVEVIYGYEDRLERFPTILQMLAKQPERVTDKAVWLASSATDGKTGLEIRSFSSFRMMVGVLNEGWRRLIGKRAEPIPVEIISIPPAG